MSSPNDRPPSRGWPHATPRERGRTRVWYCNRGPVRTLTAWKRRRVGIRPCRHCARFWTCLTVRERRQAFWLVPLVIAMTTAEVAGIASITPFLALMFDPAAAQDAPGFSWAYRAFGFESDRAFLLAVGIAVVVVLLGANALLAAGNWVLFRYGSMRNHSISRRLLIRYLQQPYAFFLQHNSASLANNILQEVTQIVDGVILPGLQVIAKGLASIAIVALLVAIDPVLALLVSVVLGGAYGVIYYATRTYLKRIGTERVIANQARYRAANEAMGGIKELKLSGREAEMIHAFSRPSRRYRAVPSE